MTTITATEARKSLYKLLDEVSESHEHIHITGKRNTTVLISEDHWRAVQETFYLHSVPGMTDSIREGIRPLSRNATRTLTGDLAGRFYQVSSKGCKKVVRIRA